MIIIDFIKEALALARNRHAERRRRKERRRVALMFNDIHCYTQAFGIGKWMCPDCNEVHASTGVSFWDGLHFPACCNFPSGNRLYHSLCATTSRTKP